MYQNMRNSACYFKTKPKFQGRQIIMFVFSFFVPELFTFSNFIFSCPKCFHQPWIHYRNFILGQKTILTENYQNKKFQGKILRKKENITDRKYEKRRIKMPWWSLGFGVLYFDLIIHILFKCGYMQMWIYSIYIQI